MQKKSKADIKKLIAELHQKPKDGVKQGHHDDAQINAGKGSKGAKQGGTYRPKI